MLSCEQAANLASEALDRPLGLRERLTLRLHYLRCELCSRYARQLAFIRAACFLAAKHETDGPQLSEAARARIRAKLKRET